MEEIARLPSTSARDTGGHDYKINYRIFDFEAVYKLRVDLMTYLRSRDTQWVPHMIS